MSNTHSAGTAGIAIACGMQKIAAIPAPTMLRKGLMRLTRSGAPKSIRNAASGVRSHLGPVTAKSVASFAAPMVIGWGAERAIRSAADRIAGPQE